MTTWKCNRMRGWQQCSVPTPLLDADSCEWNTVEIIGRRAGEHRDYIHNTFLLSWRCRYPEINNSYCGFYFFICRYNQKTYEDVNIKNHAYYFWSEFLCFGTCVINLKSSETKPSRCQFNKFNQVATSWVVIWDWEIYFNLCVYFVSISYNWPSRTWRLFVIKIFGMKLHRIKHFFYK